MTDSAVTTVEPETDVVDNEEDRLEDVDLPPEEEEEPQELVTATGQLNLAVLNVVEEISVIDNQIKELTEQKLKLRESLRSSLEQLQRFVDPETPVVVPPPPSKPSTLPSPAPVAQQPVTPPVRQAPVRQAPTIPTPAKKTAVTTPPDYVPTADSKLATIILFIGDNLEVTTTEIRQHLIARKFNQDAGVELGRLKDKDILLNNDRGVYSLAPAGIQVYQVLGGKRAY